MLATMRTVTAVTLALSTLCLNSVSAATVVAGPVTDAGCFDDSTGLSNQGTFNYQSKGHCQQTCVDAGATIMAMTDGNECWCGTTLPPKSSKQSDSSKCSTPCVGYPTDICGGDGFWSVYYTSTNTNVAYYGGGSSGSSSSASGAASSAGAKSSAGSSSTTAPASSATTATSTTGGAATVITSIAPGKTVIITQAPAVQSTSPADVEKSKKGGSNTAGIAAGVVVGIVVLGALIGAAFFFWRRKQRREAETGHQQLNDYSAAASPKPMAFRPAPGPDSRIDPEAMAQRRMSDGSIADNEDYSRRILKVTNA